MAGTDDDKRFRVRPRIMTDEERGMMERLTLRMHADIAALLRDRPRVYVPPPERNRS